MENDAKISLKEQIDSLEGEIISLNSKRLDLLLKYYEKFPVFPEGTLLWDTQLRQKWEVTSRYQKAESLGKILIDCKRIFYSPDHPAFGRISKFVVDEITTWKVVEK